jgi:hypothetical protein
MGDLPWTTGTASTHQSRIAMSPGSPWCTAVGPVVGLIPWMIQTNAAYRCHSVGDKDVGSLWDHQTIEPQSLFSAPVHICCKIQYKSEPQVTFNTKEVNYFIHTASEHYKFFKYYMKITPAKIFKYTLLPHPNTQSLFPSFMSPFTFSCSFVDILPPTPCLCY